MTLSNGFRPGAHRASESEFRSIVAAHAKTVRRRLRRLRVPERDLHDMSQEVFLVVHRKLDGGHDRNSLSSLVNGVCVRVASSYHRLAYNRRRMKLDDAPLECEPNGEPSLEDELHARALWNRVFEVLRDLDDDQRRIVILHDLDESAMSRVAEAVGCPLQTAYSRLRAAYRTMRLRCRHTEF
jgi:RNA polymerase sigma-70 factor (ECF subfamily)